MDQLDSSFSSMSLYSVTDNHVLDPVINSCVLDPVSLLFFGNTCHAIRQAVLADDSAVWKQLYRFIFRQYYRGESSSAAETCVRRWCSMEMTRKARARTRDEQEAVSTCVEEKDKLKIRLNALKTCIGQDDADPYELLDLQALYLLVSPLVDNTYYLNCSVEHIPQNDKWKWKLLIFHPERPSNPIGLTVVLTHSQDDAYDPSTINLEIIRFSPNENEKQQSICYRSLGRGSGRSFSLIEYSPLLQLMRDLSSNGLGGAQYDFEIEDWLQVKLIFYRLMCFLCGNLEFEPEEFADEEDRNQTRDQEFSAFTEEYDADGWQ